jgi:beta-phosphoglucomutase-like phosphatase (HAD superfamily)
MDASLGSCVVIKDSFAGIEGVAVAGMTVLGFAGGGHIGAGHDGRMRGAGGHHVLGDMAALPKLLSRL